MCVRASSCRYRCLFTSLDRVRWWQAFDNVILFPAARYVTFQGVSYGEFADLQNLPLVILFPLSRAADATDLCPRLAATPSRPGVRRVSRRSRSPVSLDFSRAWMPHTSSSRLRWPVLFLYTASTGSSRNWRLGYRVAVAIVAITLCLPSIFGFLLICHAARHGEVVSDAARPSDCSSRTAWTKVIGGADRRDATRGRLFLLPLHFDVAVPDCAPTRVQVRCLYPTGLRLA